ncbi:hypothetical protein BC940DRAFT_300577 [Gongronella butleri]|nr:hypothetical protein BC940DRAFT_300577 [Gongronella butleri]
MPAENSAKQVTMPTIKSNTVYENWKVYSLKDKLMFRCGSKKANWYLSRGLAITMPDQERAIRLTFEAKGDGHGATDYMTEERQNICVVCGTAKHLTRHHVVPEVYRREMPLSIKSKSSRDILVLCKQCHDRYESHAVALKKELARRHGCPLEGKGWVDLPETRRVKKAAGALLRAANKIPAARQEELATMIKQYQQDAPDAPDTLKDPATPWQQVLETCASLDDHFRGPDFIEHGESVMAHLMEEKSHDPETNSERWPRVEAFIRQWRQHFLDHAQPKYLSAKWSVDAEIYNAGCP